MLMTNENAGDVRYATARDLARRSSKLLDQVAREKCTIVLLRLGRPVARLVPSDGGLVAAVDDIRMQAARAEAATLEEARAIIAQLTDGEKATIAVFGEHPPQTRLQLQRLWDEVGKEAVLAVTRLEGRELVIRNLGSYIASPIGLKVAAILRSEGSQDDRSGDRDAD